MEAKQHGSIYYNLCQYLGSIYCHLCQYLESIYYNLCQYLHIVNNSEAHHIIIVIFTVVRDCLEGFLDSFGIRAQDHEAMSHRWHVLLKMSRIENIGYCHSLQRVIPHHLPSKGALVVRVRERHGHALQGLLYCSRAVLGTWDSSVYTEDLKQTMWTHESLSRDVCA